MGFPFYHIQTCDNIFRLDDSKSVVVQSYVKKGFRISDCILQRRHSRSK